MRVQYFEELKNLNVQMQEMGALCEDAITHTENSLINGNCEEAKLVRGIHE